MLNFLTILLIGFLDYLGIALVYPVFTAMVFDQNYPLISLDCSSAYRGAILGILIGLTPLTQFLCAPLLGAFSDLKGRKKTLMYGTLVGCFAYILAIVGVYNHSLTLLLLYRIFIGICSGTIPVAQAMIADISTEANKARRFSFFSASLGLGFTIGPFIGGKLADANLGSWCGYATPFIATSFLCLFSLFIITWKFPESLQRNREATFNILASIHNVRKTFGWPKLQALFLATFSFAFGWSFFNEFIPLLLRKQLDFSLSDVGNYYAYGGAWYALASGVITPWFLQRFSPEKITPKALLGSAFCMLSFLFIQDKANIWFILPPLMFCLSFTYPTTAAMVSNKTDPHHQGEVLGIYQSVIGCAMGLSPLLAGSLVGLYPSLTALGGSATMLASAYALKWSKMAKRVNQTSSVL